MEVMAMLRKKMRHTIRKVKLTTAKKPHRKTRRTIREHPEAAIHQGIFVAERF
jgi:hypothetical protein